MSFTPPADWHCIHTIDAHTAGEPLRVVIEGVPEPEGDTILEKRRFAREHLDPLRTGLVREPRGHDAIVLAYLLPPCEADADVGVVFANDVGYLNMCGHGAIGVAGAMSCML